jgi:hypothetical protein
MSVGDIDRSGGQKIWVGAIAEIISNRKAATMMRPVLNKLATIAVAVALGSAAITTDALARGGGGGHGGGGGGHFGGGGGHFGGAMGGGHIGGGGGFGGGHFGGGHFAGGRDHFGHVRGFGAPYGYYDDSADESCSPLDRVHPRRLRYVC